jgi:thymidylate synthase (FAD)
MKKRINIYGDGVGFVELIDYMGNDKRAVNSARVSFLKDKEEANPELNEKDKRLLRFLLREQHTSPFEHSVISLKLNVPLFVRSHIMRHRTFSYNEVSRRYTEEAIAFHTPHHFRKQASRNLQCSEGLLEQSEAIKNTYQLFISDALKLYEQLLNDGVAREQARAILPQCLYTSFYMTGNLLNWIKFLKLRLGEHVQPETKEVAQAIKAILSDLYPATFTVLKEGDS